jgi:hypothetical protein
VEIGDKREETGRGEAELGSVGGERTGGTLAVPAETGRGTRGLIKVGLRLGLMVGLGLG